MAKKKSATDPPPDSPPAETAAAAPPESGTTLTETPPSEPATPPGSDQKPQPVFKVGPIPTDQNHAVGAAVWENEVVATDGRTFTVHNVTLEARYRDGSGEWKSAKGFRGSQLYALMYCLQRASDFILARRGPSNDCPF
jgi:hypothetical protein